jgi:hypothetical protein
MTIYRDLTGNHMSKETISMTIIITDPTKQS